MLTGDSSAEAAIQKAINEVNIRLASGEGVMIHTLNLNTTEDTTIEPENTEQENTNENAKQTEREEEEQKQEAKSR